MGILDDVVINAKSVAEAVGRKAGQIVDVSKLRVGAAEVNAEITKRYQTLGQYVYENSREALAADPEAMGKMAELDGLQEQLSVINKELTDKQNKTVCPTCGKHCSNTDIFCSTCGAKLINEPEPEAIPQEGGPNDEAAKAAAQGPDPSIGTMPPREFP